MRDGLVCVCMCCVKLGETKYIFTLTDFQPVSIHKCHIDAMALGVVHVYAPYQIPSLYKVPQRFVLQ